MPSQFESDFAGAAADLMQTFGRSAEYRPPSGEVITGIKARINNERQANGISNGVRSQTRQATITLLVSAVANPVSGGTVVIEGEAWKIVGIPNKKASMWKCECEFIATERQGVARVNRA